MPGEGGGGLKAMAALPEAEAHGVCGLVFAGLRISTSIMYLYLYMYSVLARVFVEGRSHLDHDTILDE